MTNWRKIFLSFLFLASLFVARGIYAQTAGDQMLYGGEVQKTGLAATLGLSDSDPRIVGANLIRIFLGFLGLVAVGLILYAGFIYMKSEGNAEEIEKSKNILKSATIGLLIILSAFAIVTFILSNILKATGGDGSNGSNVLPGGGWFDGAGSFYMVGSQPMPSEMNVFRDQAVTLSFNLQLSREIANSNFFELNKVAEYNLTKFETVISTDTLSTAVNSGPVPIVVATSGDMTSIIIKASSSCEAFNGVSTTTHQNCLSPWSKYHVKVKDTVVSLNGKPVKCDVINHLCEFDFYTNDSFGEGRPVIRSITPVGGFCRQGTEPNSSSTNEACLTSRDCQHWLSSTTATNPDWRCDTVTPNAKAGNFVSISGRNFGSSAGLVEFSNQGSSSLNWISASTSKSVNSACAGWTDSEIVAVMPAGIPLNATSSVKITTADSQIEYSNDKFGPKINDILANNIERPGLCQINPNHGLYSSTTVTFGQKLLGTWAYMGDLNSPAKATTSASGGSIAQCGVANGQSCEGSVPNITVGNTSTFVLRGLVYSNFIGFHKDLETYKGPMITSLEPTTGPKGQYVTIGGSGFGYATKDQLGFGNGSSSRIALFVKKDKIDDLATAISDFASNVCRPDNASCTKDFVEGSFTFPPICSDDLWKNNQVIVKVPKAIDDGTDGSVGEYYLYLFFPKDGGVGSWLLGSDQINENNALNDASPLAKQEYFIANKNALLLPGLCAIRPSTGLPGVITDTYGEYFPVNSPDQNLYFSSNVKTVNSSWLGFDAAYKADHASATVPIGAITGAVNIKLGNGSSSNPIDFKVGSCKNSNECGEGISCCQSGSAHAGRCMKGSEQDACYASLRSSVFAWSFSTYLSTSSESCSGFVNANACMLANSCPNSPGTCQSQEKTKVVGSECTDSYCQNTYSNFCKGNKCVYDQDTNYCASSSAGTAATIVTCSVASSSYLLPGTNSKKIEAYCNEVGTGVTNNGIASADYYWQYQPKFGASCEGSSTMSLGGWCTIKGINGQPKTCSSCSDGFKCQAGKCVIGDAICPGNSVCDETSGKCRENFTCECCCKIGHDAQDCCSGLICTPDRCVNSAKNPGQGPVNNPANFIYGQCTGCKKFQADGTTVDQDASNLACSCNSGNRYCNTESQVYINGAWKPNLTGICQDRAKLNEPCSGSQNSVYADQSSAGLDLLHVTQKLKIWQLDNPGFCPTGSFLDYGNKCTVGGKPLRCATNNATSSTVVIGSEAVCREVVSGLNYWQIKNEIPCPANTYLNGSYQSGDSWCTISTSTPPTCKTENATSSAIVSGSTVTCNQLEAWYKPDVTYRSTTTVTTTHKINQTIAAGTATAYWQSDSSIAGKSYLDYNGQYTIGTKPAICTTTVDSLDILPGATTTCHLVSNLTESGANAGYWQIKKPQGAPCPAKTVLAPAGSASDYNTYPWCTVVGKVNLCSAFNATTSIVNGLDLGSEARCNVFSYLASSTNQNAFCSANLPVCQSGLQCDPNSCTCQNEVKTVATSEIRAGEPCTKNGNGACMVGAPSCDFALTSFACIPDSSSADCRCCCNPGVFDPATNMYTNPDKRNVVDSKGNSSALVCMPNKTPCSGGQRGLFCGCVDDKQCNNGADGCGIDTCCNARPFAVGTYPYGYAGEVGLTSNTDMKPVCRNTQISMSFNGPMDSASYTGNIIVAGDYGTDLCPSGTTYLTTIVKPSHFAWLNRLFAKVITFIVGNDSAYAQANRTYCAIEGRVSAEDSGKKIVFSPLKILDYNRVYYVTVIGDATPDDALREGVLSINGIGMHDDDGTGLRHTMGGSNSYKYASSSISINGRDIFGYTWHFKTKDQAEENQGICLVNSVVVNTKATSTSWVFTSSINNPLDDLSGVSYDTIATDSDKDFVSKALTKDNQPIVPIASLYSWNYSWSSQNTALIGLRDNPDGLNDHKVSFVVKNQKDAQTTVAADAVIDYDSINTPSTKNKKFGGRANVRVFMCNNPWPPLNDPSTWPWKDTSSNCLSGACESNNFEFYYCRDAGGPGTADDLPVFSTSPVGLGKGQGYCESGYSYNQVCGNNSNCLEPEKGAIKCINKVCSGGTKLDNSAWPNAGGKCFSDGDCQASGNCRILLKEFFFGRDSVVGNSSAVLTASANPLGMSANLSWAKTTGATKYKVYYGLQAGKYTNNEDVPLANCNTTTCTAAINNLVNDKTYYFVFTSLNSNNTESPYSAEASVLVADKQPPAAPSSIKMTYQNGNTAIKVSWSANTDDTVKYRVYYGISSGVYGTYVDAGAATSVIINGWNPKLFYYLTVTALDASGNESPRPGNQINSAVQDLQAIKDALEAFKKDNGRYPNSLTESSPDSGQWDGYCTDWGDDLYDNWIPGLVPKYISYLPHDTRTPANYKCLASFNSTEDHQYLYDSNGVDYKLISHLPINTDVDPALVDPARCATLQKTSCAMQPYNASNTYWGLGYWTSGAATW